MGLTYQNRYINTREGQVNSSHFIFLARVIREIQVSLAKRMNSQTREGVKGLASGVDRNRSLLEDLNVSFEALPAVLEGVQSLHCCSNDEPMCRMIRFRQNGSNRSWV